jgi:hypothetical protein
MFAYMRGGLVGFERGLNDSPEYTLPSRCMDDVMVAEMAYTILKIKKNFWNNIMNVVSSTYTITNDF